MFQFSPRLALFASVLIIAPVIAGGSPSPVQAAVDATCTPIAPYTQCREFTTPSADGHTFTVPEGVTSVHAEVLGAGGSDGGGYSSIPGGTGGPAAWYRARSTDWLPMTS